MVKLPLKEILLFTINFRDVSKIPVSACQNCADTPTGSVLSGNQQSVPHVFRLPSSSTGSLRILPVLPLHVPHRRQRIKGPALLSGWLEPTSW